MMILKVTKNKALHSGVDFSEWKFNISFCQISNLSFGLNKNELKKNCKADH